MRSLFINHPKCLLYHFDSLSKTPNTHFYFSILLITNRIPINVEDKSYFANYLRFRSYRNEA